MTRGNQRRRGICVEQLQNRVLLSSGANTTGVLSLTNSVILTGATASVQPGAIFSQLTPPSPGDANLDGVVDTLDFNALAASYGHKGDWSKGDFNADGRVDHTDLNLIANHFGQVASVRYTFAGDANLDGTVDTLDFNSQVGANFGGTGKVWTQADFNYDGLVDTLDFNNLAANFGPMTTPGSSTTNDTDATPLTPRFPFHMSGRVLVISGTSGNDSIVTADIRVTVAALTARQRSILSRVRIEAGDGNDRILVTHYAGELPLVVLGGAGYDVIHVDNALGVTIDGGAGEDELIGGRGNDSIGGSGGNDSIAGQGGDDLLNGGAGSDGINGGDGSDTVIGNGATDFFDGGTGQ